MQKEFILGRKILVLRNNKKFYYTVKKISEITKEYIIFDDKFGESKFINFKDIIEII